MKKNLITLLEIIKNNGNINKLKRQNLSFKQIADLTDHAIMMDYLINVNDKIILTDLGEDFLTDNLELVKLKNKSEWIEPDFNSRIMPIDKNDVFLPRQNELSFLNELL